MASADRRLKLDTTPSGVVVSYQGRRLTGQDPVRSCRRRLPENLTTQTLYLVFSPLLGYGIAETALHLPPTAALLLVEFEPALAELWEHSDAPTERALRGNVRYARNRENALAEAYRLIEDLAIRRVEAIHLTGGTRLHAQAYTELHGDVGELVQRFWSNRGTEIRLGRRWVANIMRNAPMESIALDELRTRISSTVVLVGAGPHLDRHREELRHTDPVVTVAALDTALPALAASGITPDLVFSMDAQLANAYDLLPWRWDRTVLVADLTVHPSIVRRFSPERRAFFASRFSRSVRLLDDPLLQEILQVPPRGSIAPAAIEILVRHLGVRTVATVGVDFWYRPPRTHAAMTGPDRRMRATMHRLLRNDGFPEVLNRPVTETVLRTGEAVTSDTVLVDQARHVRQLVQELKVSFPDLAVYTADREGLDTGAVVREGVLSELARGQTGANGHASPSGQTAAGTPGASLPGAHAPRARASTDNNTARLSALFDLLKRLRAQETRLATRDAPTIIDASLDFVLFDMPQWPLLTVRQDWAQLHREGILRSIRDYRRRLENALRVVNPRVPL